MTPEERAAGVVMEFHAKRTWAYDPTQHAEFESLVAAAVREAVLAERERCAGVLEGRAAGLDRRLAARCYDDAAEAREWRAEVRVLREAATAVREGPASNSGGGGR